MLAVFTALFLGGACTLVSGKQNCPHTSCATCGYDYFAFPPDYKQFDVCFNGIFVGTFFCGADKVFTPRVKRCVSPESHRLLPTPGRRHRWRSLYNPGCGLSVFDFIVGGIAASSGKWPWQASIQMNNTHYCGGVLVHEQWIATAAHCVYRTKASEIEIIFGVTNLKEKSPHKVSGKVEGIFLHPYYKNGGNFPNDTALIKLSAPVPVTLYVRPVCLPSVTDHFTGSDDCWISGWGTSNETTLNDLRVTVTSLPVCRESWRSYVLDTHICVGDGYSGACRGDSGGPLVCLRNGAFVLAGTTSWGNEQCRSHGFPGIFTRIAAFVPWIERTITLNS